MPLIDDGPSRYKFEWDAEIVARKIEDDRAYHYYCIDHEAWHVGIDTGAPWHDDRTSCTDYLYYGVA